MMPAAEAPQKKTYQVPKLTTYGDLTQLTLGTGMSSNMDQPHMAPRTAP